MGKTITTDIQKCVACRTCELACAVAHSASGDIMEAVNETPRPHKRVAVEAVEDFAVPMQCRHCEDAPCVTVCPTGAIKRQAADSPVLVNPDLCIGCKYCLVVCPFGAIEITEESKVATKCDFCINRPGASQAPACVEACPTHALQLVEDKELSAGKRRSAAREQVLSLQKET